MWNFKEFLHFLINQNGLNAEIMVLLEAADQTKYGFS